MSSLAPSWMIFWLPPECYSSSTTTCEHTSVNKVAIRSLISLCRIEGSPPLGQDNACSIVKEVPQVQRAGVRLGGHP